MRAVDVSQWQGDIDWNAVKQSGVQIAVIKIGGGDAGLYFDSKAGQNYYAAKAAGLAVGCYWFAGAGDPVAEADKFLAGCAPLEDGDVFVLDWEVNHPDPDSWCAAFLSRFKERTGVVPLIYMNTSTENARGWEQTRATDAGLWVADYRYGPTEDVPIRHWSFYAMHQWGSTGRIPGIAGNVDTDEWFGTIEQFKKYGWHDQAATPAPVPVVEPVPTPVEPTPAPTPTPVEPTPVTPADPIVVDPTNPPDSPVEVLPAKRPFNFPAIIVRSFSTFVITVLTFVSTNLLDVTNTATLKVMLISAVAAGVAAVKNIIVKPQEAK